MQRVMRYNVFENSVAAWNWLEDFETLDDVLLQCKANGWKIVEGQSADSRNIVVKL